MNAAIPRAAGAGLCAGLMLSMSRAPLGLDLVTAQALDGGTRALFAAVPWILLAGVLGRPARALASGVPTLWLLVGGCLGFAAGALFVGPWLGLESRFGVGACMLVLTMGAYALVRPPIRGDGQGVDAEGEAAEPDPAVRVGIGAWFGLFAGGAGVALAVRPLFFHLEHTGLGSDAESAVRGAVFAGILLLGAIAFGPLLPDGPSGPKGKARATALAAMLAVTAATAFVGVHLLGTLQEPRLLDAYLRRFGQDFTRIGMLEPTALLASLVLVAPGLAAGTALAAIKDRIQLSGIALGVGVGVALWPVLVDLGLDEPGSAPAMFASEAPAWTFGRVALGVWIAAAGAIAAVWSSADGRTRAIAIAVVALAAATPALAPRRPIWILSPWHRVPVEPELAWKTGDGLLTVERDRDGAPMVTLDRRRMTPLAIEEGLDALRFDVAFGLLPDEVRNSESVRVLLVGQMTPARAFHISRYENVRVDHTVPWHARRDAIDRVLFADADPMPGNAIAPDEARKRIAKESYDLVVVPPSHGALVMPRSAARIPWAAARATAVADFDVPAGTTAVCWVGADSNLAARDWPGRVVLASRGLDDFELGFVSGDAAAIEPGAREDKPWMLAGGGAANASMPLAELRRRPERRDDVARARTFARLAAANAEGALGELTAALLLHAEAQAPSSPFDTLEAATEINPRALEHLSAAVRDTAAIDPFLRQLWEGVAIVLTGKRMPDKVLAHIEPVAAAYGPWALLERAVSVAYREFSMPEEAAFWLNLAVESQPYDLGLLLEAAEWTGRAGDGAGEVALIERALAMQPDRHDVERLLGIAMVRAGDPRGRALVEEHLAEDPNDEELAALLGPGPHLRPDPLPPGVTGMEEEHGDHADHEDH